MADMDDEFTVCDNCFGYKIVQNSLSVDDSTAPTTSNPDEYRRCLRIHKVYWMLIIMLRYSIGC